MAMIKCDKCGGYYTDICQSCKFAELNKASQDWHVLDVRPSENANLNVENDDY